MLKTSVRFIIKAFVRFYHIERALWSQREITPLLLGELDVHYCHMPVPDHQPPTHEQAQQFSNLVEAMTLEQRPLLVHCHAGVGRTGTLLHLFYLARGYSYEAAYAEIKRKRVQCILLSDTQKHFLQSYQVEGT